MKLVPRTSKRRKPAPVPTRGVVYYGFGRKMNGTVSIVAEAILSMKSLREHNPDVKIAFTGFLRDKPKVLPYVDHFTEVYDLTDPKGRDGVRMLHEIDRASFSYICGLKLWVLEQSPFHETLYLDSDTTIFGDISPIWNFPDVCVALEEPPSKPENGLNNAGVMFLRMTGSTKRWLDIWNKNWKYSIKKQKVTDQCVMPDFRNVQFGRLDYRVWNVRPKNVEEVYKRDRQPIILHSRFHPGMLDHLPGPICEKGVGLL